MPKIKIYPRKASALNVRHPIDGALRPAGSLWEDDGFTARMLTDRAVTTEEAAAWQAPAPEQKPAAGADGMPATASDTVSAT
jgi:hypothetical protein